MDNISWLRVPEVEDLPEKAQDLFAKAEEKLGLVPNVFPVFALTPEHFMRWFRYYDFLMRDEESALSQAEREMIGLVVSAENRCEYCLGSHGAYLRELTGDHVMAEVITHNYRRAALSPRERALLDFAVKLTNESFKMSPEDLAPLREEGLSDEAIFELAQVAAMFNFTNRLANALGWKPNEVYYSQHRQPAP
ncbi:peroxidase-related enzyme [soil metagenome]